MSYDSDTRTITVYSENIDLVGLWPYKITASFSDYPDVISEEAEAKIEFINPCIDPEAVVSVV